MAMTLASSACAQALPGGFVLLRDIDPTILQDIDYAGPNNFVGRPLAGYDATDCDPSHRIGSLAERAGCRHGKATVCELFEGVVVFFAAGRGRTCV